MKKGGSRANFLVLAAALVPPALIITWGESSEFNINLWFLPTVNVSSAFLEFEELLIASYYLFTPSMIFLYLRNFRAFLNDKNRFLMVILVSVSAFVLLRYLEFLYDLNGPPIEEPFGNLYPLAFWSLPLIITATAVFFLSGRS